MVTLENIAENVVFRWQPLGLHLGLSYLDMERIRNAHPHDVKARVMGIFHEWQRVKGPLATKKALKKVLISLNYGGIGKKYFPND